MLSNRWQMAREKELRQPDRVQIPENTPVSFETLTSIPMNYGDRHSAEAAWASLLAWRCGSAPHVYLDDRDSVALGLLPLSDAAIPGREIEGPMAIIMLTHFQPVAEDIIVMSDASSH